MSKKGGTSDEVSDYDVELLDTWEGDEEEWHDDDAGEPDTSFDFGANVERAGDADAADAADAADDAPRDPLRAAADRAAQLNAEAQRAGKLSSHDVPQEARRPRTVDVGAQLPRDTPREPRRSERARAEVEQAADRLGASVSRAGRQLASAAGALVETAASVADIGRDVLGLGASLARGLLGIFKR